MTERTDLQAAYLIDGRLPESELAAPPGEAVWERWETADQEGAQRRGLSAAYSPGETLSLLARQSAKALRKQ